MTQAIVVEREGAVLTLRLNRPDKKNALTREMYSHLAHALEQADTDDSVHAVLICGTAECFTSGNDIADFLQQPPADMDSPVFRFMRSLLECRKPVVAAVAGAAVGIGTTLLLHCDLVYVSCDARLRMPFVNLGLSPEFGSSLLLSQLLGQARAAELLLLGEGFSGEQAATWGLANAALPGGVAVLEKARDAAQRLAALAPAAVQDSKRLMKAPGREQLRQVIEDESWLFIRRLSSPEAEAALSGFINKVRN
ncbi:MAG: enoyl-CoA hydratase-related protein [Pseudomonadota bacterium]